MSYIGPTALEALWTKLVALLAGKADRTSVYSKSEINYLMATHDWGNFATISGSGSGSSNTSDCVHLTGTETISGVKTFSAAGNANYNMRLSEKRGDTAETESAGRRGWSLSEPLFSTGRKPDSRRRSGREQARRERFRTRSREYPSPG